MEILITADGVDDELRKALAWSLRGELAPGAGILTLGQRGMEALMSAMLRARLEELRAEYIAAGRPTHVDRTTIAQPAPAPDSATMEVGAGDAKEMPPGLAEALSEEFNPSAWNVTCAACGQKYGQRGVCPSICGACGSKHITTSEVE